MMIEKMQNKLKKSKKLDSSSYGSSPYMAPEMKWKSVKSDMYAFGVVLFEMCHQPFPDDIDRMNNLRSFINGTVFSQTPNTQHKEYIKVNNFQSSSYFLFEAFILSKIESFIY